MAGHGLKSVAPRRRVDLPPVNDSADSIASPTANPASAPPRHAYHGFDTRELVLAWCLWLIGVWGVLLWTIGWTGPAFRWMAFAVMVGFMGLWPAARLSQEMRRGASARGARRVILLDWFCMNLVFQAVLWPMSLAARWEVTQTLWVMAAVAAWSLLTGLLIAWGRSFDTGGKRLTAMLMCVGLVLIEPVAYYAVAIVMKRGWLMIPPMRLSPVQTWWALTGPPSTFIARPWSDYVIGVGVAAVVGWAVLAVLMPRQRVG